MDLLVAGAGQRFPRLRLVASPFANAHIRRTFLARVSSMTKTKRPPVGERLVLVAGAGLEPATSWL